jgi:outer membrane receptor protein involved in Fe transport
MHKYLLLLKCLVLAASLSAQDLASVTGRILDGSTGEALPYASVTVNTGPDNILVGGTISEDDGRFTISGLEEGNYLLMISFVGYRVMEIPLLIGELNRIFDLGRLELQVESEVLDEVTITARESIVSANLDRQTFRMDENVAQAGGSVLDALKGLPGITVDPEGKVILRGSDKVAVLIDEKQSSLTGFGNQKGLDNIPISNIESIEIIHNPSARYDASGMAGIININYRKEEETGLHGDLGFAYGIGSLTPRKEDLPTELGSYTWNPKYIPSANLNYRLPSVNLFFLSEFLLQDNLPNNEFTTRNYDDGRRTASQVAENRKQYRYILNGGMDWFINPGNQLTFSAIYDFESHIDTSQIPYINMDTRERYRYWNWSESEVTGYMNFNFDFLHRFTEPGHELKARISYTKGWEDETYNLNDSSVFRQASEQTHIIATEHTSNLSADYVKPLSSGRFEAGSKIQLRRIPVTYTVERGAISVIYQGLGEWSDWGEDIYAGYLNYVLEKPSYNVEAGLRAEQTFVFYDIAAENTYYDENDSYNYFELFPSIRLSYKMNDKNRISIFYNRRVDRPGEPELRIFPKYDDPELLKVGNPYLRPQFTQTFEIAYRNKWESGSIFLSAYYRLIDDPFTRVYGIDTSNADYSIVNKIYQNVGSGNNTGIELIFSQDLLEFWETGFSFNIYRNEINPYTGTLLFPYERPFSIKQTTDNTWDLKFNNQFRLPAGIQLQLNYVYYAPKNIAQGKQMERSSLDLGAKKAVFKGKGEINFSFSDVFNNFGIRQKIEGDGFTALYENYYETQIIRLGFRYKF